MNKEQNYNKLNLIVMENSHTTTVIRLARK